MANISNARNENIEITGEQLLLQDIQALPCLVEPFFQQIGIACLAGSSDTGKSTLLRQLAIAIVTGENDFLGFKINAIYKSVIYVSTEDLERETAFILKKQANKYKPELLRGLRLLFDTTDILVQLEKRLTANPADLIIIDCFADIFGKNLNDTQHLRGFLHPYQQLAQKYKCLILFLHHTGKRTEDKEPNKNNLLGGQGFEAKMRMVIELRADQMNPKHRHLCIVKGNYLPANYKKESIVLQFDEETFTFSNTGERTPFEALVKRENENGEKMKYFKAKQLIEQGINYEVIAEELGYGSKGSVTKLLDRGKKNGWDSSVSTGNNGNGLETAL